MKSLPRHVRVGYGLAESGIAGSEVLLRVSLLIFYTDVVGLRPDLAGYAIALCVLWDAITDPIMGWISDRFALRGQRRRPYIMIGAIFLAVTMVVLFNPPNLTSQSAKFLWLFLSYFFVNTAMTIIAVPHAAFAGDLAAAGPIRTEMFGWRLLFGNIGLTFASALPATPLPELFKSYGLGTDQAVSVCVATVIILSAFITFLVTRGLDRLPTRESSESLAQSTSLNELLLPIKRDSGFRALLFGYFIANIGLTLNSSFALYYYRYRLLLDEVATRTIIAVFMAVFCVFIPIWIVAARRLNSQRIVLFNMLGLGVLTTFLYPILPIGNPHAPLFASILGGVFVAAVVLLDVLVADMAERQQGTTLFGLYFGLWKMGAKLSRAAALVATGHILQWIGFIPNTPQSAATTYWLAVIFGPLVGVHILVGVIIIFRDKKTISQRTA